MHTETNHPELVGRLDRTRGLRLGHFIKGKRGVVLGLIAVTIAGIASAAAFATHLRLGDAAPTPNPINALNPQSETAVVSYDTSFGEYLSGWTAATTDGRPCTFFQVDPTSAAAEFHGNNGGFCMSDATQHGSLFSMILWQPTSGGFIPVVEGFAAPGSGINQLALLQGSTRLSTFSTGGGVLIGQLPPTTSRVALTGGQFYLVGYDTNGDQTASTDLNKVVVTAGTTTPSP